MFEPCLMTLMLLLDHGYMLHGLLGPGIQRRYLRVDGVSPRLPNRRHPRGWGLGCHHRPVRGTPQVVQVAGSLSSRLSLLLVRTLALDLVPSSPELVQHVFGTTPLVPLRSRPSLDSLASLPPVLKTNRPKLVQHEPKSQRQCFYESDPAWRRGFGGNRPGAWA